MKLISKFLFVFLFSIIAISFNNIQVNAADNNDINDTENEKIIDAKLLEYGYPQRLVNELSYLAKKEMIDEGITEYVSAETITYDQNNKIIAVDDYNDPNPEPQMVPFGTINSMKVTITAGRQVVPSYIDEFILQSEFQWTISPVVRGTDLIGFAWDGNKFNAMPNTSKVVVGGNGGNGAATYSSNNLYASSFTGVGWSFPLPSSGTRPIAVSKIRIKEVKSALTGSSQFHSLYTHTHSGTGTIGLNFGVLTVAFAGTKPNDQRASFVNFNH